MTVVRYGDVATVSLCRQVGCGRKATKIWRVQPDSRHACRCQFIRRWCGRLETEGASSFQTTPPPALLGLRSGYKHIAINQWRSQKFATGSFCFGPWAPIFAYRL